MTAKCDSVWWSWRVRFSLVLQTWIVHRVLGEALIRELRSGFQRITDAANIVFDEAGNLSSMQFGRVVSHAQ